MELLKLKDVSHIYHSEKGETLAVSNVSFSVSEGEFLGLVGPSGSGKTTLLSLLAGLLKPTSGAIERLNGGEGIGYMLQRDQLFDWLTIRKNVLLGLEIRKEKTPPNIAYADSLLQKYGLMDFRDKHPYELSGGMRQRCALIRTIVLRPKIILLDEPFSALDYKTRLEVAEDVHCIISREGLTGILVTHDISEAISLCDRVIVLTKRPAKIKSEYIIDVDRSLSSLKRREHADFSFYFKKIWEDLEETEDEEKDDNTD